MSKIEITKKEFKNFYETVALKYNYEITIKFNSLELIKMVKAVKRKDLLNELDNNKFCFLSFLLDYLKIKYECRLIKPKNLSFLNLIEELTGLSKEKITYIEKNFSGLLDNYKGSF